MVENGRAKVIAEFLRLRDQREGRKATESVPRATAVALATKGTELAFRTPDLDFVPLTVSWFRLVLTKVLVCVASQEQPRAWDPNDPRLPRYKSSLINHYEANLVELAA